MKRINTVICLAILALTTLGALSCSKKKEDDAGALGKASMTMKVNGTEWAASMTTLFSEQNNSRENGDYYLVNIAGVNTFGFSEDHADVETMGLYIVISGDRFRNPKGKYPIIVETDDTGTSWCMLATTTGRRGSELFLSVDPANTSQSVGTLEITGFEIGDQKVMGQSTGVQGYTKLSGSFQLDLFPRAGSAAKLKITEGKFNLSDTFTFDW